MIYMEESERLTAEKEKQKMQDNDIIKALECCQNEACESCCYNFKASNGCMNRML